MFLGREYEEKARERKRMVKLAPFFCSPSKTALCGHLSKKNHHICFLVHGHSSWSTFTVHLVSGHTQKLCKPVLLVKKSDHGSWIMKSDHGKRPSVTTRGGERGVWTNGERASLHHGPWSHTMEDGPFSVAHGGGRWLHWSPKESIKALNASARQGKLCRTNVGGRQAHNRLGVRKLR